MNNAKMPKQMVTARIKGTRKRGRPRKRWTDEIEEDLKTMGIRNLYTAARNRKQWRRAALEAEVHDGRWCLRMRRRRRRRRRRRKEEENEKEIQVE